MRWRASGTSNQCGGGAWIIVWIAAILCLNGCGDPPTTPVEQRGDIEIYGILLPQNVPADSIFVVLDGDTLGYVSNPHLCTDLYAGKHFISVKTVAPYLADTLEYLSSPAYVTVTDGQTSPAIFSLTTEIPVSPYVGYRAPDFSLCDLNGDTVRLSDQTGKVILLYFFTGT